MSTKVKKQVILHIPYFVIALFMTKIFESFRLAGGADLSEKLMNISTGFSTAFQSYLPSFNPIDFLLGMVSAVIRLYDSTSNRNHRIV